ncbi:MAG: PLP-dependent aminotransferase family protein [Proteobacteria bacterium]|nr:PLP-dependent aminotransferase family protein [Pseudomonadota bacterium]
MLELVRTSDEPLGDQIVEGFGRMIAAGRLAGGVRLPSVRQLARKLGVSVFTVVTSYDRLVARGLIEPRHGAGFFVAARTGLSVPAPIESAGQPDTILGLAKGALGSPDIVVPAGSGFFPPGWLADAIPPSVTSRVIRRDSTSLKPSPPAGEPALREQLALRLNHKGIRAGAANVLVTFGASHAFDVIIRGLLAPGDAVLVEDPGYFVLFAQLQRWGLRLLPVPRGADGPDLDRLEILCRTNRPRAMFMQTLVHNPTGSNATPATCHRLLALAERYEFLIVEDDVYGDLAEDHELRLAEIDEMRRVIHVGSMTKVLGPGLRVGFLAADPAMIERLVEVKILSVLSGATLPELLVAEVLESGRFRRHVEQLRRRLAKVRAIAAKVLRQSGVSLDRLPESGMFLWGRVGDHVDVDELVRAASAEGILLANGKLFRPTGDRSQHLRFNAGYASDPTLLRFLESALAG